jgi:hypothetical protein
VSAQPETAALTIGAPPFDGWSARAATALRDASAAVVVGDPAVTTALVAIGAARGVARTRTVTIVDLIGDAPPLRALAVDDDPHGVADVFVYGISPKAVTRRTHADDRLFVIPGGTEPFDPLTMVASPRWSKLIAEYRAEGALLLFVTGVRTPGLAELVAQTDGVVAVGDIDAQLPPGTRILATAQRPGRPHSRASRPSGETRRRIAWQRNLTFGLAAALIIAAGAWYALRQSGTERVAAAATPQAPEATVARDTTIASTSSAQLAPESTATAAATDAAYAHLVATVPSYAVALRRLRRERATLTAATIDPLPDSTGALHYEILAGASSDSTATGSIHAPLALVLARNLAPDSAHTAVDSYLARGIPAYALTHIDGRANVYAGAFENAQAAAPLTASLKAAGLAPVLVNRTGRPAP